VITADAQTLQGSANYARVPRLAPQHVSSGTHKLQVLHINFVMIHTEAILTLTRIKIRLFWAHWTI